MVVIIRTFFAQKIKHMDIIQVLTPKASRRSLLFFAGVVWLIAGVILISRGISLAGNNSFQIWLRIFFSFIAGGLFYMFVFSRISIVQIRRIINLEKTRPCLFSFFSLKSYIMMILMIVTGLLLRKSGIILPEYLSLMYITMGIPLLISSLRFCYHGIVYKFEPVG